MAALALCLVTVAFSLSSCGFFVETFLSEYTGVRTHERDDDEETKRRDPVTEALDIETDPPYYTERAETTRIPETTLPETTVPETTDNIPDELEKHVYLENVNNGRCKTLVGNVNVTVLIASDSETSWDGETRSALISSLAEQEKRLESDAAGYGKELDVTFSFIDVKIEGKTAVTTFNLWEDEIIKAAGFTSKSSAQKELDEQNDADSNPIVIALNRAGRAYARQQTSERNTEMLVLYSSDMTAFRHELYHLYGAEDFYYPKEVKELAAEKLPESIMNSGSETDALTAFIIGWDDEMDENAYEFLKGTSHLTAAYLKEENAKEMFTGTVTDHMLSYGVYTGYLEHGVPNGYGKLIYTEGGSYEGYLINGSFHGEGTRIWENGDSYSGGWNMGNFNGKGTYTWASGDKYTGDWVNGVRTGKGTHTWASGSSYTGDFVDDKRTGYGTYKWTDGASYTGYFIDGVRTGNGKMIWADGTRYEGGFANNEFEGQGTYTSPNGLKYVGAFKTGKYHGYAKVNYANGAVYEGYFANGYREGQGTMIYDGGSSYTGSWKADLWHGKGRYTYANGAYYEGDFLNHKFHGQGTYETPSGYKYVGAWENDSRTGYGVAYWVNGASYEGNWLYNKFHGYGKYVNQYGQVIEGTWENDTFVG